MSEAPSDSAPGPRVLVTRAAEDAPVLAQALAAVGLVPVGVFLLERRWLPLAVAAAAQAHPVVDWVVITSATAAEVVSVGAPTAWRSAQWAAVGPATAERLLQLGTAARRVPDRATAADLIVALGDLTGLRVVYPRADLAPPTTLQGLEAAGATVVDVVAYENALPDGAQARLARALPVAVTTLMSGSAAERLAALLPEQDRHRLGKIVVIGPSTARAAREVGLAVDAVADPHTVAGLVRAVTRSLLPS